MPRMIRGLPCVSSPNHPNHPPESEAMDNTTYIALSRINALTHDLEVTSNNLANANTTGFKSSRELFSDYIV